MRLFAQTAYENVRDKLLNLREKDAERQRMIITTSAFPPEIILIFGKLLTDFVVDDGKVVLTLKIAKNITDQWTDLKAYSEMKNFGWIDETGNLTGYRNANPETGKIGFTVLIGADKVQDASGLADFYRCDPETIWIENMDKNFKKWVKDTFNSSYLAYDDKDIAFFDSVLQDLLECGCADLYLISKLLQETNFTLVQTGTDARKILLKSLQLLKLPSFVSFSGGRRKRLSQYLAPALRFFRYELFMEESKREKAMKTIDYFSQQKNNEIQSNVLFSDEIKGALISSDKEFLESLYAYVSEEDPDAKEKLLLSDFITIYDEILAFKPKKESVLKERFQKVSGGPIEAVLTSLWLTFRDYKKNPTFINGNLETISVYGTEFRYDSDSLVGNESVPPAERNELAKHFLNSLLGGVDRFLNDYLKLDLRDNYEIKIASAFFNEEIEYRSARTAEPSLSFSVTMKFDNQDSFIRKFAWRLPETQSYRMAKELIEWAYSSLKNQPEQGPILPVFHILYHEELIRAKDDEETRQVFLHSIRENSAGLFNLITRTWNQGTDPLLNHLKKLGADYGNFITAAKNEGLHSVFLKQTDGKPSAWEILRDSFKSTARAYVSEKSCSESAMAPMLMRAFLFVERRDENNEAWSSDFFEKSGIATILHPSVIEMLGDRIAYLFACFNYLASHEWSRPEKGKSFSLSRWQDYLDLATIQMPIGGLIGDENKVLNTQIQGSEFIHKILPLSNAEGWGKASLSTRLLLRYEGFTDENVADAEFFEETRESRLLQNILGHYLNIHPHARDGISLAFYWNKDIQPIISGIHEFLEKNNDNGSLLLSEGRVKPYSIFITVFTETGEDCGINRWVEEWKERWDAAESEEKFRLYRFCRFSISHRVVPGKSGRDRKFFSHMIRDSLDVDIAFFYDFIDAGAKGNEFMSIGRFDVRGRTLKFPITEKSFCSVNNPYEKLKRSRVISNPQFEIASLHLETMVRIKNSNTPPEQEHVLVGYGDFAPWQEVIDEAHRHAEWIVCIDPSIDDTLAKTSTVSSVKKREIVGFGSGVGLHGELNYTISTEQFALTDVCYRIQESIKEIYSGWNKEQFQEVAEAVVRSGQTISGVSLVKATGTNENYIHDFMAYSLAKKILENEEKKFFCSTLVSLDAYDHWFEKESKRPDLLWIKAQTDEKGKIILSCCLIECKLALENEAYISKALEQIKDGFKTLIPAFSPRMSHGGDDERPDQRYWWLQIHRLLASRAIIETQEKESLMASMERLADGDYEIEWNAFIFAFWSNRDTDGLELAGQEIWADGEKSVKIQTLLVGKNTVYDVCTGKKLEIPSWQEDFHPALKQKADFIELPIFPSQRTAQDSYHDDSSNIPVSFLPELSQEEKEKIIQNEKDINTVQINHKIPERIFLGISKTGNRKVFWEFGSSQLHNRHLLVFGASGMGKTYAIQCLLCEMGEQNQNSLVMDYTNGFLPKQLEAETKEILDPLQHYVQEKPLPITPFKLQSQEVDIGRVIKEQSFSAAKRIAGTFKQVYETLGDQQYSCLLDAINEVIEEKDEKATLEDLLQVLESYITDGVHSKNYVQSTLSKIKPFIGEKPFSSQDLGLDWEGIFNDDEHRCHVFQFAGMDSETARLVIEFTLWDLNSFARGTGSKNTPKVIVLDEAQNLDLTDQSPVSKFLTEGRKFGLSLILATQTMQNLKGDKLARLFQAAHKLFFRPADVELQDHARLLAQTVGDNKEDWLSRLTSLKKGECYSVGPSLNEATGTLETKAFKITITSLGERFNDE